MPTMALDILPARTEPASLSGLDTGYKAHGTSAGKNDGPSFREMLEKAEQKDTTDGKIKESDDVSQKNDVEASDKVASSDEKPVSAEKTAAEPEEKEVTSKTSQSNQVEKASVDETPLVFNASVEEVTEDIAYEVPSLPENAQFAEKVFQNEQIPEEVATETAAALEIPAEEDVSPKKEAHFDVEKKLPQELSDQDAALSDSEPVVQEGKTLADDSFVMKNATVAENAKEPAKENVRTEAALAVKSAESNAESLSDTEKTESKKDKKSRFSEYDSMLAMLSKQADKEAPAANPQTLSIVSADEDAVASAKLNAALPASEKIQIVDLRTEQDESGKTVKEGFSKQVTFDAKGNAEISLSLASADKTALSENGVQAGAEGLTKADFASMLSKEIETSAGDLVKTGSIVLQNNSKGSINLILHPEQLGNVKIKLELSENQISGKIVVASREAYDAFKENISAIKEAFSASGFETGGFELAWGGSGDGGSQNQQENRQFAQESTVNNRGMKYVDSMPDVIPAEYAGSGNVNLVA